MDSKKLIEFVSYCHKHIKGDEKGESQIFLDHLFVALGHIDGLKGAGAEHEFRIRDRFAALGLPDWFPDKACLVTDDCAKFDWEAK